MLETGEGQQVIIAVGRGRRSGQWPDQEEPIIDDVECFGFVPKVMLSSHVGSGLLRWFFGRLGCIGIWPRLVGTDIYSLRLNSSIFEGLEFSNQ